MISGKQFLLGLTGGVACGKSTVAASLARGGWGRIDCDRLATRLLDEDPAIQKVVCHRWGQDLLTPEGRIDRLRLGKVVFSAPGELAFLEEILHPAVQRQWMAIVQREPQTRWVVEVPLLFEAGWEKQFSRTMTVAASPARQEVRLAERPGSIQAWRQRIARQWPLARKMDAADVVLWNNGSLSFLELQIESWQQTCFT